MLIKERRRDMHHTVEDTVAYTHDWLRCRLHRYACPPPSEQEQSKLSDRLTQ